LSVSDTRKQQNSQKLSRRRHVCHEPDRMMAPLNNMHDVVSKPHQEAEQKAPRLAPEHTVPRASRRLKMLMMLLAVCVVAAWIFALIWIAIHML
jgi:hypothetical protein